MPIKSIIIDNKKTKAQRISPDKVQLDLVAMPLDENSDMEPNVELRLYVNGKLFQNLKSDLDGYVKESIIIDDSDNETVTMKIENTIGGIQSKIKNIFIEDKEQQEIDKKNKQQEIDKKNKQQQKTDKKNKEQQEIDKRNIETNEFISHIKQNPQYIRRLPYRALNEKKIVKYALMQDGTLLSFSGRDIKDDKEMVLLAVKQSLGAFYSASDRLKTDEKFVLECLQVVGLRIVRYLSDWTKFLPKIKDEIEKANKPIKDLEDKRIELEKIKKCYTVKLIKEKPYIQSDLEKYGYPSTGPDHENYYQALNDIRGISGEIHKLRTEIWGE